MNRPTDELVGFNIVYRVRSSNIALLIGGSVSCDRSFGMRGHGCERGGFMILPD